MRGRANILLALFIAFAVYSPLSVSAAIGKCLKDTRPAYKNEGSKVRIGGYLCEHVTTDGETQKIGVEFIRLSELAISELFSDDQSAHVSELIGTKHIHENAVYKEIKTIFERFANPTGGTFLSLELETPRHGTDGDLARLSDLGDDIGQWSSVSNYEPDIYGIPLLKERRVIQNTNVFPVNVSLYYACENYTDNINSILGITVVWRYFNRNDIENYAKNLAEYNKLVRSNDNGVIETEGSPADPPSYFEFIKYVTRNGWPEDFLYVESLFGGCGDEFRLIERIILLDVAVIKNRSDRPLHIGGLIGSQRTDYKLYPVAASKKRAGRIPLQSTLQPGEAIIIPLSTRLAYDDEYGWMYRKFACSKRLFNEIRSKPRGFKFRLPYDSPPDDYTITKIQQSFRSPRAPNRSAYIYGPEIALKGISVDGQPILFDRAAYNFLNLTAGDEGGSCPFLYSWDGNRQKWVLHRKVIHKADHISKKTSDQISFDGFVGRFRLTEWELELAYVDHAELAVALKNGRKITLRPSLGVLAEIDGIEARIYSGQRLEFEFKLPKHVAVEQVEQSILSVTGYYRHYGSFNLSAN